MTCEAETTDGKEVDAAAGVFESRPLTSAQAVLLLVFAAALFVFVYSFNAVTPLWADEYSFQNHMAQGSSPLAQAVRQYLEWNGRFFAILLMYTFVWPSMPLVGLFKVLNSAMFVGLTLAAFTLVNSRLPRRLADFGLLGFYSLTIWLGCTCIAAVAMWLTGSVLYLWSMTANLIFLTPLVAVVSRRTLELPFRPDSRWMGGLLLATSLFAGAAMENMTFPISLFTLVLLARHYLHVARLPRLLVLMSFAYLAGAVLLFAAPGNFGRLDGVGVPQAGRVPYLAPFFDQCLRFFFLDSKTGFFFVAMLVVGLLSPAVRERRSLATLFGLLCAGSITFHMITIPFMGFGWRMAFGAEVFLCLAGFALLGNPLADGTGPARALSWVAALWLAVYAFGDAAVVIHDFRYINGLLEHREKAVAFQQSQGISDIEVAPLRIPSKDLWTPDGEFRQGRYFILDLGPDSGNWINGNQALHYGVSSIRTVLPK